MRPEGSTETAKKGSGIRSGDEVLQVRWLQEETLTRIWLVQINALPKTDAFNAFKACCGCVKWAEVRDRCQRRSC